jgi:septation ring formation regulator EzrA
MATPEDIENRLSAVERDVAQLREQTALAALDASAARTLSAGADRDVSEVRAELRAHTGALNALRETQIEAGHGLENLERITGDGFATLGVGMREILTRLDGLAGEQP